MAEKEEIINRSSKQLNLSHLCTDVQELSEQFRLMDRDKNGVLSKAELRTCLKAYGFHETYADTFIKKFDRNGDGAISFDEFMNAIGTISKKEFSTSKLRRAFRQMDTQQRGKISAKSLRAYLNQHQNSVNTDEVEKWIREFDVDGDGMMDFEEFLNFIKCKM